MVSLQETSTEVLISIYSDNRINDKKYTKSEALNELKSAIEHMINNLIEE